MDINRLIAERLVHTRMKKRLRESNVLSISLDPKKVERAMKASGYQDDEVLEFLYDKYGLEDGEDYQVGNGDLDFLFYKSTKADKCISELGTDMRKSIEESTNSKVPDNYYKKIAKILNHRLGQYESYVNVGDIDIISETPGSITLKVTYSVDVQIPMYDPEDGRTYYETDTEYRTQTMTFDFDELDESDRIVPGRDERGNRVNWIDNDVLVSDDERRNADPNPGRDPDYEEPVKLKYNSDTWSMIDKYDIDDWESHDSYISVSKDSYEKMLNGSNNKRYIMNLRLKEDLTLDER